MATKTDSRRIKIKRSIRSKISGTTERPRLTVYRSNKGIYAQVIDDLQGRTVASASSFELGSTGNTVEMARQVGSNVAEKAKSAGIDSVVFDRNGYLYHGKVKALAEGARQAGLTF